MSNKPTPINPDDLLELMNSPGVELNTTPHQTKSAIERNMYSPFQELGKYDDGLNANVYQGDYLAQATGEIGSLQEYYRSQQQGMAKKLLNGALSRGMSIGTKVWQGLGHVGGAALAMTDEYDIDTIWDNAMVNSFAEMDEELKEIFPVHKSEDYLKGNLGSKMLTPEFWSEDFFDGLAFLASAAVPGTVIGKGLNAVSKIGNLSKVAKASKVTKFLMEKGLDPKSAANMAASTVFNTVSEAGFEAKEVSSSIKNQLAQAEGYASFEEMPDGEVKAKIESKGNIAGTQTFGANTIALSVPNMFQHKWLHGGFKGSVKEIRDKVRSGAMKVEDYKNSFGRLGKQALGGVASEGLWEENIQTSIQQYWDDWAKGETDEQYLTGYANNMMSNIAGFGKFLNPLQTSEAHSDQDEGATAILLGSLLGGGMSTISSYKQNKVDSAMATLEEAKWQNLKKSKLILDNLLKDNLDSIVTTTKDTDGNMDTKVDPYKVGKLIQSQVKDKKFFEHMAKSIETNDPMYNQLNREMSLMSYAYHAASNGIAGEDLMDMIKYSTEGVEGLDESVLETNKGKIETYHALYGNARNASASSKDLLEDSGAHKSYTRNMERMHYYLEASIQSIDALKNQTQSEQNIEYLEALQEERKDLLSKIKSTKPSDQKQLQELFTDEIHKVEKMFEEASKAEDGEVKSTLRYKALEAAAIQGYEVVDNNNPIARGQRSNTFQKFEPRHSVANNLSIKERQDYERSLDHLANVKAKEEFETKGDKNAYIQNLSTGLKTKPKSVDMSEIEAIANNAVEETASQIEDIMDKERVLSEIYDAMQEGWDDSYLEASSYKEAILEAGEDPDTIGEYEAEQLIAKAVSDLTTERNALEVQNKKTSEALKDIKSKPNKDYSSYGEQQIKEDAIDRYLDSRLASIEAVVFNNVKDVGGDRIIDEDFSQSVAKELRELKNLINIFESRDDLNPKHKSDILQLLTELQSIVNLLDQQSKANSTKRQLLQKKTGEAYVEGIQMAVQEIDELKEAFSSLAQIAGFTSTSPIDEVMKLLADYALKDGSPFPSSHLGLESIMYKLKEKLSPEERIELLGKINAALESMWNSYHTKFNENSTNPTIRAITDYLIHSPNKAANSFIRLVVQQMEGDKSALLRELTQDTKSPFYKLFINQDINQFFATVDEGALDKHFSKDEITLLYDSFAEYKKVKGLNNLKEIFETQLDYKKLLEIETLKTNNLLKIEKDTGEDAILPTIQQTLAYRKLLRWMFNPINANVEWKNWALLQGALGSGKTTVGVNWALTAYLELSGNTADSVFTVGHAKRSSENVKKSVTGKTNGATGIQDLLDADLSSTSMVVVDEVFAFTNDEVDLIKAKVDKVNESRKNNPLKLLALGDKAQNTTNLRPKLGESPIHLHNIMVTSPLTVVYRTSIAPIINTLSEFQDNREQVAEVNTVASQSLDQIMQDPSTAIGVVSGSMDQLLSTLKKPSARSRVLIVNNKEEVAQLEPEFAGDSNVEVVDYIDAQGAQWDEVYLFLNQSSPNAAGKPWVISEELGYETYNKAMYTSIGRAKQFVFMATPDVNITSTPDNNLSGKVEKQLGDIRDSKFSYTANLQAANDLYGSDLKVTQVPKEDLTKEPEETPPPTSEPEEVVVSSTKEEDIVSEQEEYEDDDVNETFEEEVVEDSPDDIQTENEDGPVSSKEEMGGEALNMSYPSNGGLRTFYKYVTDSVSGAVRYILDKALMQSQDLRMVKFKRSDGKDLIGLVAQSSENTEEFVTMGILSTEEISNSSYFKSMIEVGQGVPSIIAPTGPKGKFTMKGNMEDFTLGYVPLKSFNKLTFKYGDSLGKSIMDTLASFYNGFYSNGAVPMYDLTDPSKLVDIASIRIFKDSDPEKNNPDYNHIIPGIPYMVLPNSTEHQDKPLFIRLEPKKIGPDSKLYKTVNDFYGYVTAFNETLKYIGDDATFDDKVVKLLVSRIAHNLFEVDRSTPQKPTIKYTPSKLDYNSDDYTLIQDLPKDQFNRIVEAAKPVIEMIYGPKHYYKQQSKEKAQALMESIASPSKELELRHVGKDDSALTGKWFIVENITSDPDAEKQTFKKVKTYGLSSREGDLVKALNVITSSNKDIKGFTARYSRQTPRGKRSFAKSIMVSDPYNYSEFYGKKRKYFLQKLKPIQDYLTSRDNFGKSAMILSPGDTKPNGEKVKRHMLIGEIDEIERWYKALMTEWINDPSVSTTMQKRLSVLPSWDEVQQDLEDIKLALDTKPLKMEHLAQMLELKEDGKTSMRQPLMINGSKKFGLPSINELGSKLTKDSMTELSKHIESNFESVSPTSVVLSKGGSGKAAPTTQASPQQKAPTKEATQPAETTPEDVGLAEHIGHIENEVTSNVEEYFTNYLETTKNVKPYIKRLIKLILDKGLAKDIPVYKVPSSTGFSSYDMRANTEALLTWWTGEQWEGPSKFIQIGDKVGLNKKNIGDYIHEVIHLHSIDTLILYREMNKAGRLGELTQQQRQFGDDITALFETAESSLEESFKDIFQGTKSDLDITEFIANLSNPNFFEVTTKISLVKQFWNAIVDFLGLSSKEDNVYEATFKSFENWVDGKYPRQSSPEAKTSRPIVAPVKNVVNTKTTAIAFKGMSEKEIMDEILDPNKEYGLLKEQVEAMLKTSKRRAKNSGKDWTLIMENKVKGIIDSGRGGFATTSDGRVDINSLLLELKSRFPKLSIGSIFTVIAPTMFNTLYGKELSYVMDDSSNIFLKESKDGLYDRQQVLQLMFKYIVNHTLSNSNRVKLLRSVKRQLIKEGSTKEQVDSDSTTILINKAAKMFAKNELESSLSLSGRIKEVFTSVGAFTKLVLAPQNKVTLQNFFDALPYVASDSATEVAGSSVKFLKSNYKSVGAYKMAKAFLMNKFSDYMAYGDQSQYTEEYFDNDNIKRVRGIALSREEAMLMIAQRDIPSQIQERELQYQEYKESMSDAKADIISEFKIAEKDIDALVEDVDSVSDPELRDLLDEIIVASEAMLNVTYQLKGLRAIANPKVYKAIVQDIYKNWSIDEEVIKNLPQLSEMDLKLIKAIEDEVDMDTFASGLKAETENAEYINEETKISDFVKDFLAYIKRGNSVIENAFNMNNFVNHKYAFVRTLQIIHDYIDLNSLSNFDAQIKDIEANEVVTSETALILSELTKLVYEVNQNPRSLGIENINISFKKSPIDNKLTYALFVAPEGINISDRSYDSLNEGAHVVQSGIENPEGRVLKLAASNKSIAPLINAYIRLNPSKEELSPEHIRDMSLKISNAYRRAASLETIRAMHNQMSSLAEKNYMIAKQEAKKGFDEFTGEPYTEYITKYYTATSSGIHQSLNAILADALRLHNEKDFKGKDRLDGYFIKRYDSGPNKGKPIKDSSYEKITRRGITPYKSLTEFLSLLGLSYLESNIQSNTITQAVKRTIKELLNETEKLKDPTYDIDQYLDDNAARLKRIMKIVSKGSNLIRNTSVQDAQKKKVYKYVQASYAYMLSKFFTQSNPGLKNPIKGVTGSLTHTTKNVPEHFLTEEYSNNNFINGTSKSYGITEFDMHTNKDHSFTIAGKNESKAERFARWFKYQFVTAIDGQTKNGTEFWYDQPFYQPSDRPRLPAHRVSLLKLDEIKNGIKNSLKLIATPKGLKDDLNHAVFVKKDSEGKVIDKAPHRLVNFEVLFDIGVINKPFQTPSKDGISQEEFISKIQSGDTAYLDSVAQKIYEEFEARGTQLKEDMELPFKEGGTIGMRGFKALGAVESKLNDAGFLDILKPTDLYFLFYANQYLNSYHTAHLFMGDQSMFKNGGDVVKRSAGIFGPGVLGWTNKNSGLPKKFKVLMMGDSEVGLDSIKKFLSKVLNTDGISKKELAKKVEAMSTFFSSFEDADAQGFMLPERLAELNKGFAAAFKLGNVHKPMHYQIRTVYGEPMEIQGKKATKDFIKDNPGYSYNLQGSKDFSDASKSGNSFVVYKPISSYPVYLKYSSVVLSDDLVENNPELQAIRKAMRMLGTGEMIFNSGVKAGKAKNNIDVDELISLVSREYSAEDLKALRAAGNPDYQTMTDKELSDKLTSDSLREAIPELATPELDNKYYKMQYNPAAKPNKGVAYPTQLSYFMSLLDENTLDAKGLYNSLGMIMARGNSKIISKTFGTKSIVSFIKSKLTGSGSEAALQLLSEGISHNNPSIEKKMIIQLASAIEKTGVRVRLNGGKLVLQSAKGVRHPKTGERLKYKLDDKNRLYAEVILPGKLLSDEQKSAVKAGKEIFVMPDMLGFRIPSTEIHSSVPLKVVGTYDSLETNVIIAPRELVALHGSDFDVDSLFIMSYEMDEDGKPVGFIKEKGKYVFDTGTDINGVYAPTESEEKIFTSKDDKLIEKYLKNKILHHFINVASSPSKETRDRMTTPISTRDFDGNELTSALGILRHHEILDDNDGATDLSDINQHYAASQAVQAGIALTGIYANDIKSMAYFSHANDGAPANIKEDLAITIDFGGKPETFNGIRNKEFGTGVLVWQHLDALVNLAIDNVKELVLPRMGINKKNGSMFSALTGLGVPVATSTLLFNHPITKEISNSNQKFTSALAQIKKGIKEELITSPYAVNESDSLNKMIKSLKEAEQSVIPNISNEMLVVHIKAESLDTVNVLEKIAVLDMIQKANTLADSLQKSSQVLSLLRDLPVTIDAIDSLYSKISELWVFYLKNEDGTYKKLSLDELDPAVLGMDISSMDKFYNDNPAKKIYINMEEGDSEFSYDIPTLFHDNPHILSSIQSLVMARKKVNTAFKIHTPTIRQLASLVLDKTKLKLADDTYENNYQVRREISKYVLSSTVSKEVLNYPGREANSYGKVVELSGAQAWSQDFIAKVKAIRDHEANKKADIKNTKGEIIRKSTFKMNKFLQYLVIEKKPNSDIYHMKFHTGANMQHEDLLELQEEFRKLRNFEVQNGKVVKNKSMTNGFSQLQKDFVTYSVLNYGFDYSASNYALAMPPALYRGIDKAYNQSLSTIIENESITDSVADRLGVLLASANPEALQEIRYWDENSNWEVVEDTKTKDVFSKNKGVIKFPDGSVKVAWDRAYNNTVVEDISKNLPNKFIQNNGTPYVRVFEEGTTAYYQRLNKSNGIYDATPITENDNYVLTNGLNGAFEANMYNIYTRQDPDTLSKVLVKNERLLTKLVGSIISVSKLSDPSRFNKVYKKVTSADKTTIKLSDPVAEEIRKLSSKAGFATVTADMSDEDVATARAAEKASTTTGTLESLEARGARFNVVTTKHEEDGIEHDIEEFYEDSEDSTNKYARVTGKLFGMVNAMTREPFKKVGQSFEKVAASKFWGKDVDERLEERDTEFGRIDYSTYVDKLKTSLEKFRDRGTIMHNILQLKVTSDPAEQAQIERKIEEMMALHGFKPRNFAWIHSNYKAILKKSGLNIFDEIPEEDKDQMASEVTVASDVLGIAGTVDLVIQHSDGTLSLKDFKTGARFDLSLAKHIYKYGRRNVKIYQNPREKAKLQLMLYSLIIKSQNLNTKFKDLDIVWIPTEFHLNSVDHRASVEVEEYLGMIEDFIKLDDSEVAVKMRENLNNKYSTEELSKLFDPKEYKHGYSSKVSQKLKNGDITPKTLLAKLLDELRMNVMYDLNSSAGEAKADRAEKIKRAQDIMQEILELKEKEGVELLSWDRDISWMSMWVGSNADINNPIVQSYVKMMEENKLNAEHQWQEEYKKFWKKLEPVIDFYYKRKGKTRPPTEGIPMLRGLYNKLNKGELFEWMYKDSYKTDDTGKKVVVGREFRQTPEDWAAAVEKYDYLRDPDTGKIRKEYTELADFAMDSFGAVFDNDLAKKMWGRNGAVANRVMTEKEVNGRSRRLTNLDKSNGIDKLRRKGSKPFKYLRGFVPVHAATMEEVYERNGGWMNKKSLKEMWKRQTTMAIEDEYEEMFNEDEGIPMKGLGNKYTASWNNASTDLDYIFKSFVKHHIYKDHLDDTFTYGKGVEYYMRSKQTTEEIPLMENSVKYMKVNLDMNLRNKTQTHFDGRFTNSFGWLQKGNKAQRINYVKLIKSFKSAASAPIMWLKPLSGGANGIFAYIYTLKEGMKGSLVKRLTGTEQPINGFTLSDMKWAKAEWARMQKQAITGTLKENKLFLLAKELRYLPDNYDWLTNPDGLFSAKNKIFSQSMMYKFHSIPEEFVAFLTMASQLKNMKISSNHPDESIRGLSIYDLYHVVTEEDENNNLSTNIKWGKMVDGEVQDVVRGLQKTGEGEYKEVKGITAEEARRLKYVYQRMHGGYRQEERTRVEYYVLGQTFMQFKRYMPTMLKNMFSSKHKMEAYGKWKTLKPDANGNEVMEWVGENMEGRFHTMMGGLLYAMGSRYNVEGKKGVIANYLRKKGFTKVEDYQWNNMSEGRKDNVFDIFTTWAMWGLFYAGAVMMFGADMDDDKDDPFFKYYMRIINNMSQQNNPWELFRDFKNNLIPASFKVFQKRLFAITDMSIAATLYAAGREADALTSRGELKGWREFQSSTRLLASWYQIKQAIEGSMDEDSFFMRYLQ